MIKVKRLETYCCPYHDLWGSKQELYDHQTKDKCDGSVCQQVEFVTDTSSKEDRKE